MENSTYQILQEWHELFTSGVITEAEFINKKKELLGEKKDEPEIKIVSEKTEPLKPTDAAHQASENKIEVLEDNGDITFASIHEAKEQIPTKEKNWFQRNRRGVIILIVLLASAAGWLLYLKPAKQDKNIETIQDFIQAEQGRDFSYIYSFFSPNMGRYWNLYNPSEIQLEKQYNKVWREAPSSYNRIERIEKVDDNTYDLYTYFTFTKLNGSTRSMESRVRFVFDQNGKILECYGIK